MRIFLLAVVGFILTGNTAFAQSSENLIYLEESPLTSSEITMANELPKEGTYQIIFRNSEAEIPISDEQLYLVNHKRDVLVVVYIIINPDVKIKILPYNEINDPGFEPVPTIVFQE